MKSQPTQEYQHLNNMLPCLTPHCIRRERWLFWRDDGMKIDLVSSNFQASNCLVYEGGKEPGLDEVLRI